MKCIDVEKLKAEIERLHKVHSGKYGCDEVGVNLKYLEDFINSLQQEQFNIDEIKREWYNKGYLEGRKNAHIPARELGLPKSWDFQQEQPEVDFEKEVDKLWQEGVNGLFGVNDSAVDFARIRNIALHFFNFGLNARKEDTK